MPYNGGYNRNGGRSSGFKRTRRGGRRNRNRGGYRRNVGTSYNFTYGNVMDKVIGDIGKLKGLINTEFKAKNVINDILPTTTMNITLLNGLTKGDNLDNRDGRIVRIKSVWIKQYFTINPTATDTFIRIMVIIDKQPNSTLLTIGEILESTRIESMTSLNSRKRLIFLMDKVITLTQGSGTAYYDSYYRKLDMHTVYDASNLGDISDISTNALYLCTLTNEVMANAPFVGRLSRIRFIDN